MNTRDRLALELFIGDNGNQSREQSIEDWHWLNEHAHMRGRTEHYGVMAAHILATGYRKPRVITSAEELDALPEGTLIRAVNEHTQHMGAVLEKYGSSRPRWLELDPSDRNDGEDTVESGYVLRWRGSHSVTVIYEPGQDQ